LVYQAKEILSAQFDEGFGRSKHNDKKNDSSENFIYSRNSYRNVLEKCCTFLKFCKEQFGLRYLEQIKPEYFTEFVKAGNDGNGYNKNTANSYKTALVKLQNGYNLRNSGQCVWINEHYKAAVETGGIINRLQMPRQVHDEIIKKAYKNKYETGLAFDIARNLGLRVSEITNLRIKDFLFDKNEKLLSVYIYCSKGGRHRIIYSRQLTGQQKQAVVKAYEYFRQTRDKDNRLFPNKSGSYQRAFERIRDSISGDYKHCGIHSMRKEFAKDFYKRKTLNGKKNKDIKIELTQILGHNRLQILKHYLKNSYGKKEFIT
jgi:Phage integrase family.